MNLSCHIQIFYRGHSDTGKISFVKASRVQLQHEVYHEGAAL